MTYSKNTLEKIAPKDLQEADQELDAYTQAVKELKEEAKEKHETINLK